MNIFFILSKINVLFSSYLYFLFLKNPQTSKYIYIYIFNCYLASPRPTLGHYRGDSLTRPMLITAFFYIFDPKVTGSLVTGLGPWARPSAEWGLNREPSDSYYNALTH